MNTKERIVAMLFVATTVSLLAVGALSAPAAAQQTELVDTDIPSDVGVDGQFDASVTVNASENTLVTVESNDFNVEVTSGDDDAQAQGNEVVFLNIGNTQELTHNFNVDISGAEAGDTGTINVVDNSASASFDESYTFNMVGNVATGTIEGTVTDDDGNAVSGATVDVQGAALSATTDANGEYTISGAPEGSHTLEVSSSGFQTETATVSVTENAVTTQDFSLSPTSTTVSPGDRNQNGPFGNGQIGLGEAGNRPTVFQGESNIEFIAPDGRVIDTLTSTDDENRVLDVPIGENDQTGTYTIQGTDAADDPGVVVQEPEVTNLEIINVNGEDVNSVTQNNNVLIGIEYNYGAAEPLDPEIADDSGVEVTNQYVLESSSNLDEVRPELNAAQEAELDSEGYDYAIAANFDDAGEFEVTAEPDSDGDLSDIDSASSTAVLQVSSDDDPELELEQNSANQGEEVDAEVTNVEDGDSYYVAIDTDDRRDENAPAEEFVDDVFVNAGDTESTGLTDNGYYYAEVEADGTSGLTRIDSEYLDDTSIDIYLYGEGDVNTDYVGDEEYEQDDVTLDVSQAEITIDSPGDTYVPGQEVDINGTVSEGVDEVSVFVRDRDNWFHVVNSTVDDDDNTYEETDFELSDDATTTDARDIVGQPGVYRYGVIDMQDVLAAQNDPDSETENAFVGTSVDANSGLTSSDFSSGASTQMSLRVAEPSLEATIHTYNGEVFQDDGLDITGTLIGPREYITLFTDSRGTTVSAGSPFNADRDDGEIDEEDLDIGTLSTGNVRGAVLSPGRDTTFGDGSFSVPDDNDYGDFAGRNVQANVDNLVGIITAIDGKTQSQTTEILLSETVEEAGSDDLIVSEEFRLRDDSSTQIHNVVPSQLAGNATGIVDIEVGEEMVISGTTNRNPDDATIVVEATEGPSLADLGTAVTEDWGQDGEWNVTIEVPEGVEPGQYTIQSDDGERISEANVTIAAEGTYDEGERGDDQIGELQNQIEELQNQVSNLEDERNDLEQQVQDLNETNSQLREDLNAAQQDNGSDTDTSDNETDDGEGQPGFTAVAALISLIAVALLAIRRQEE